MVPCGRPERQEAEEGSIDLQLQATRERLAHHLCGVVMIIRTLVKQTNPFQGGNHFRAKPPSGKCRERREDE
ncbi:hypothetical protein MGG_16261 [Pyricularia oryzae 70-15]|nr:uncharacterized protein MGG_16261 [Pyricularia oryzae 70-15]EHA57278.1 hypothetical protein MGG_16261 [Pyricularia oryzae 70-15]ELQ41321.1 hypothetical protein OOU_Y34scaffold00283g14 [Pyricularia oryzae Y34]